MIKKILALVLLFVIFFNPLAYGVSDITNEIKDELDLNSLIEVLNEYIENEIDLNSIKEDLILGKGIDYGTIGGYIYNLVFKQIKEGIKSVIQILIILIIMAIINSLEIEKDSNLSKVTSITGFLLIIVIVLKDYALIVSELINGIKVVTSILETVSPFLLAILIATKEPVTRGIISPLLLFVTSMISSLVTMCIIPLTTLGLIFNVITNLSEKVKLEKFSKICNTTAMWTLSIVLALFLGALELEANISTSVDKVVVKTAETAVSNLIPVVGKFVSDSLEVVMGSTEIIAKTVGVIGIIAIFLVACIPVIKLIIYTTIYFLSACFSEMIEVDNKITKLLEGISKQYKTLLGILIGITVTYVISTAIIIKLIGKIYG